MIDGVEAFPHPASAVVGAEPFFHPRYKYFEVLFPTFALTLTRMEFSLLSRCCRLPYLEANFFEERLSVECSCGQSVLTVGEEWEDSYWWSEATQVLPALLLHFFEPLESVLVASATLEVLRDLRSEAVRLGLWTP